MEFYKGLLEDPRKEYGRILEECVNNVLKRALIHQSEDNVTVIMVCFKNLLLR